MSRPAALLKERFRAGGELVRAVDETAALTLSDRMNAAEVDAAEDAMVRAMQSLRGRARRDPQGLVLTPTPVAASLRALLQATFPDEWSRVAMVLDPAVGTGRLLACAPNGAAALGWDCDAAVLHLGRALAPLRGRLSGQGEWRLQHTDGLAEPRPPLPAGRLVVVCNPPYVAAYARGSQAEALDVSRLRRVTGRWGQGRAHVSVAFLARVVRDLLRPGEIAGFVLPDALLNAPRYASLRREWLDHVDAFALARCDERTFPGKAVRGVLVACRRAGRSPFEDVAPGARVGTVRFADASPAGVSWQESLSAETLMARENAVIPWPTADSALAFGLSDQPTLDAVVSAHDGVNPGSRAARAALIDVAPQRLRAPRPLLEGKDVHAGTLDAPRLFIDAAPDAVSRAWRSSGTSLRAPGLFDGPRLYSRQTAARLTLALATDDSMATNSVHVLRARHPRDPTRTLQRVAAVLNTQTATGVYHALFGEDRKLFPQVKLANLRTLPFPWPLPPVLRDAADAWADAPSEARLLAVDDAVRAWWSELASA